MNTNIWILDDDESIRYVMIKKLTKDGYQVHSFESYKKFNQALQEQTPPDVLFCDIRMPDADGWQVLKQVQENKPTIKVVIMTAFAEQQNLIQATSQGAFQYLEKPFDLEQLSRLIQRARLQSDDDKLPTWVEHLEKWAKSKLEQKKPDENLDLLWKTQKIVEQTLIEVALKHTNYKKQQAADLLGLGRNTIARKIRSD
ncbi:MAG: response regulator [Methylacidiphilales bacterium]|nr:response regulator [Candidatus Methylacidiphilales bacterium]